MIMTAFLLGKKIYIENSTVRNTRRRRQAAAGVCAVGILLALTVRAVSPTLSRLVAPVWSVESFIGASISPAFSSAVAKADLVRERDELRSRLEAEEEMTQLLESKIADFTEIESLFFSGGNTEAHERIVVAHVLSRPPMSPFDTFIIDAGENRGVKVDEIVYANSVTAIGRVSEVRSTTAVVALYSSPSETIEVSVPGIDGTLSASGFGGGTISVMIPHGMHIGTSTPVYLAGSRTIVGFIGDRRPELREHADRVFAQLPISFRSISWVSIRSQE